MKKILIAVLFFAVALENVFSFGELNAIKNATTQTIEQVSQKKKLARFYTEDNSNALQVAIKQENYGVALWLLENEICDVNHHNVFGRTALNDAIDFQDIDILKTLVEHGAKILQTSYLKDPVVQTVQVGNIDAAEYFSNLGIKFDFLLPDGKNMLHIASQFSQKEMVSFLKEQGIDINAYDKSNNTPLLISVLNDDSEMLLELVKNGSDVNLKNALTFQTPIFTAISKNSNSALLALIDSGADIESVNNKNQTPFLFAYEKDNVLASEILLKAGASFPKTLLLTSLQNQRYAYLEPLLLAGADISVTDEKTGQNVLHIASSRSDGSSLSLFLQAKEASSIINARDFSANTPLLIACGTGTGFTNGVKSLILAGADIFAKDNAGNNAFHIAVLNNPDSASMELSQIIYGSEKSLLNATNKSGQTPVMIALKLAKKDTSSYLLSKNPVVTQKDSSGSTSLHYAVINNMQDCVKQVVRLGADINAVNSKNETPVLIAAKDKNEDIADYFLSLNGINIDIRDNFGKSARTYLWDLYTLRFNESIKRREEYSQERARALESAEQNEREQKEYDEKIKELEKKNNAIQARINSAAEGTDTSSLKNEKNLNAIKIAGYNLSKTACGIAAFKDRQKALELADKIEEERKVSQKYLDKQTFLNKIPRR